MKKPSSSSSKDDRELSSKPSNIFSEETTTFKVSQNIASQDGKQKQTSKEKEEETANPEKESEQISVEKEDPIKPSKRCWEKTKIMKRFIESKVNKKSIARTL